MTNQYWADAATANCVWCFQTKRFGLPLDTGEENEPVNYWYTERVFLTRNEALDYGRSRPYAWGAYKEGWRIWGVPCDGIMVELLGQHNKEFEKEVEHIQIYTHNGNYTKTKEDYNGN